MRNKNEQINYIIKRRYGGMSDADFKIELEKLYDLGRHNVEEILPANYYREWDF